MVRLKTSVYRDSVTWAKELIRVGMVVIDTETIGFKQPRICEISIVKCENNLSEILLNERIDPGAPISAEATEKHGITDADVKGCPVITDIWTDILKATSGFNYLIAYNLPFDERALKESMRACGIRLAFTKSTSRNGKVWHTGALMQCAMQAYAKYFGEPRKNGGLKTQKLPAAPNVQPHSASGDCISAIELIKGMAAETLPVFGE